MKEVDQNPELLILRFSCLLNIFSRQNVSKTKFEKEYCIVKLLERVLNIYQANFQLDSSEGFDFIRLSFSRMLLDYYTVFMLMCSIGDEKDQRKIFLLYSIDGLTNEKDSIEKIYDRKDRTDTDREKEIKEEMKCFYDLLLQEFQINKKEIKDGFSWKNRGKKHINGNYKRVSFADLYMEVNVKANMAHFFQKFYSSYIHGFSNSLNNIHDLTHQAAKGYDFEHMVEIIQIMERCVTEYYKSDTV